MGLAERIQHDLMAAMKQRDLPGAEVRLATLRMMKAAVKNRQVEVRHEPDDAEVQQVLTTLIKQREDAATQFAAGGRPELAERERAEMVVIEAYLPPALGADDIEAEVRAAIASIGASSPKDMGAVMKAAMARLHARGARVDGKQVSEAAKRLLANSAS